MCCAIISISCYLVAVSLLSSDDIFRYLCVCVCVCVCVFVCLHVCVNIVSIMVVCYYYKTDRQVS